MPKSVAYLQALETVLALPIINWGTGFSLAVCLVRGWVQIHWYFPGQGISVPLYTIWMQVYLEIHCEHVRLFASPSWPPTFYYPTVYMCVIYTASLVSKLNPGRTVNCHAPPLWLETLNNRNSFYSPTVSILKPHTASLKPGYKRPTIGLPSKGHPTEQTRISSGPNTSPAAVREMGRYVDGRWATMCRQQQWVYYRCNCSPV